MRSLFVALITVVAGGCAGAVEPDGAGAFREARERWRAAAIVDYAVEVRYVCFCGYPAHTFTRLEVRRDSVVAAAPLDSSSVTVELDAWITVEEMFAQIGRAIERGEPPAVTYDDTLGYPRTGSFRCPPNVLDCGFDFEMRALVPIE